jgi:hypothetical protein
MYFTMREKSVTVLLLVGKIGVVPLRDANLRKIPFKD